MRVPNFDFTSSTSSNGRYSLVTQESHKSTLYMNWNDFRGSRQCSRYNDSQRAGRSRHRILLIPVAEWSKARVCGRSAAGIAGSNSDRSMDFCVVCFRGISAMKTEDVKAQNGWEGEKERKKRNEKENLGEAEIFRTRPDRLIESPVPPSNVEVKEKAELYLYSSCRLSWPVTGRNLPFQELSRNCEKRLLVS